MTQEIRILKHPHLHIPFWEENQTKYREGDKTNWFEQQKAIQF